MSKRLIPLLLFFFTLQASWAPLANAEEIPVLIWERGQVQNVVLGLGDTNQRWEVFLKSADGKDFKFSKSAENSSKFVVYSINLPNNFDIGGYVVEAKNQDGETKQVAGIQVVTSALKEVTRVPLELILILFGFSVFMFFLIQIRGSNIQVRDRAINDQYGFRNLFTEKLKMLLQKEERESLLRTLALELMDHDQIFSKISVPLGVFGIILLSILQFFTGFWPSGNSWLIIFCFVVGNLFFSFGVIYSGISLGFLLLNIATAKSVAEILAIFVISSLFVVPALYDQLLSKILIGPAVAKRYKKLLAELIGAILSSLAAYQIMIIFESLSNLVLRVTSVKELLSLLIGVSLFAKRLYFKSNNLESREFKVVRAIGPLWSAVLGGVVALTIYIWTTNFLICSVSGLSVFMILACNWLKIGVPKQLVFSQVGNYFGLTLIMVFISAIYLATRVLPLNVINSSHLMILLLFPFDLAFAIFLLMSKSESIKDIKQGAT